MTRKIDSDESDRIDDVIGTLDTAFSVFSNQESREVFEAVRGSDQRTMTTKELSDSLDDGDGVPEGELRHRIIPSLAEANVILYDGEEDEVSYNPDLERPEENYQDLLSYIDLFSFGDEPQDSDAVFDSLSTEGGRIVTSYVLLNGESDREEIADEISSRGYLDFESEKAKINLHHRTLPNLDHNGMVSYDQDSGRVGEGELMESYHEELDQFLTDWYGEDHSQPS